MSFVWVLYMDEQHKTAYMVRQFGRWIVVILQLAYSVGEWHYRRGFTTTIFCAYCNVLQVFQGR